MSPCYKLHISNHYWKECIFFCIPCPVTHIDSTFIHCCMNSTSINVHLLCAKHQASNFISYFLSVERQTCLSLSVSMYEILLLIWVCNCSLPYTCLFWWHNYSTFNYSIFHIGFMGLLWTLLRLMKSNLHVMIIVKYPDKLLKSSLPRTRYVIHS